MSDEKKSSEGIQQLGPYRLVRKLGEGGMGSVYLAEDTSSRRQVALKVLPKKRAREAEFLKRFRREAEATAALDHPNIVRGFAAGEDRGYHFYVMEYCEGEALGKKLKRDQFLAPPDATDVVLQVGRGLKYAHDRGFIHRDIKPDNIVVTPDGTARILDLGLTKNIEDTEASFRTATGAALGTPHYLSPEQARGDKAIDGRTDVYSLGATYYHLVTGRVPYEGASVFEIIHKHLTEQLPDPRDVRKDIPERVVHVLRRMMAKRPDDRYGDCGTLLSDLERVRAEQAPLAPSLAADLSSIALSTAAITRRARVPAPTPSRTRRGTIVAAGAGAAAALVAVLVLILGGGSKQAPLPAADTATATAAKRTPPAKAAGPARVEPARPEPKPEPKPPPSPGPSAAPASPDPSPAPPPPPPAPPAPAGKRTPSAAEATPEPAKAAAPAPPPPEKAPPPPAIKLQAAVKALKTTFKADYDRTAGSDRVALARKLLALEAPPDPSANFARLREARDLAAQGGDPELALEAVDRLAEAFVIDPLSLKAEALSACVPKTTDAAGELAKTALILIDEALHADQYETAAKPLPRAKSAADQVKSAELKAAFAVREKLIALYRTEFEKVSAYADKPNDPTAAFHLGRFYCLVKEDWERGLPLLARGNNAATKGLAEKELSKPEDPGVLRDLCEGWLALAEAESRGPRKDVLTARARLWFDPVESKLLDADRAKLSQRLAALEKLAAPKPSAAKTAAALPKGAVPGVGGGGDVLKRVNAAVLGMAQGNWQMKGGALESPADGANMTPSYIHLPTGLPEEFDLTIVAERTQGTEDIVFAISNGANEFAMGLDGWSGQGSGVNGPGGGFNWQRRTGGGIFAGGRPRTLLFEVRKARAVLKVDGNKVLEIPEYRLSSVPANLQTGRKPGILTIGTVRSVYRISAIVVANRR